MGPREVIEGAQPIAGVAVFAFGTKRRAVTVRSQQRRAIHLVDALLADGVIGAGGRLLVIGAGAAGLTAAVRAAHAGCRVTVLESAAETLATLRGNTTRLLHPNLYSWPDAGWEDPHAQLPVLTWQADTAASVSATLERAFQAELSRTGLIECRTSASIMSPWPPAQIGSLLEVRWVERGVGGVRAELVSAVILAVGYGREPSTAPGSRFPGYWDHDLLARVHGATACLILGAGDGGMTDALRVRIRDFDQGRTFIELLKRPEGAGLERQIHAIEALPADAMDTAYRALSTAWLDTAIRVHGLRPTNVTLADTNLAFGPGRFPLNKLLVSRLWRMQELRIVQHRVAIPAPVADGGFEPVDLGSGPAERFDLCLIRFGQGNAIGAFGPQVAAGCEVMVERSIDPATIDVADQPPRGASLPALADALTGSARVGDAVETVLLYLRHAAAPASQLAAAPDFAVLRDELASLLSDHAHVAMGRAQRLLEVARSWLRMPRTVEPGVVVRALAEVLDFLCGDRLRRALRGPARRHASTVIPPNRLIPRGVRADDRRGRFDGGLERLALSAGGDCEVAIEWTRRSWERPARVGVGRTFQDLDGLVFTPVESERFFGARAADPVRHAEALARIAAEAARRSLDFLVLGEFTLHANPAWAEATQQATHAHVIAGIGHELDGAAQRHHRVVVFDPMTRRITSKLEASSYRQGLRIWREDIHPGPRRVTLAVSADDQQVALIGGEDLRGVGTPLLEMLRADLILIVGGSLVPELISLAGVLEGQGARTVLAGMTATRSSDRSQVLMIT